MIRVLDVKVQVIFCTVGAFPRLKMKLSRHKI